jgi:hypothetical protein
MHMDDLICSKRPSIRLSHLLANKQTLPAHWHLACVCMYRHNFRYLSRTWCVVHDPLCRLHVMKHQRDRVCDSRSTLSLLLTNNGRIIQSCVWFFLWIRISRCCNFLSLVNPSLAKFYCSAILSNHRLIKLKRLSLEFITVRVIILLLAYYV